MSALRGMLLRGDYFARAIAENEAPKMKRRK
jgi:hypothetical protein